ncbi:MAG: hypothetical protein ACHQYP_12560 [Nitrospiria bacterium]
MKTISLRLPFKTKSLFFLLFLFLFSQTAFAVSDLPDPTMTPGAINPDVTQEIIHQTICVKGYAKSIRPPAYYTNRLKKKMMRQYGYYRISPKSFEFDHLIPLSVGGHPTSELNLWPEPRFSTWNAGKKDELEAFFHRAVCKEKIPLDAAQKEIATDWIAAYKKYISPE